MKYTRNQINKAGEQLLSARTSEEYEDAIAIINDWRTNHLPPLEELRVTITDLLDGNTVEPILISQRLKRMSSIQYKLDLNPSMRLGGVQDIGGIRVVLDDMYTVDETYNIFAKDIGNFEFQRVTDYIANPKESGYRSIHFIYKYKSDDEKYDGLRFELQVRTKLQHSWATALETVDIHTKSALKSGQGHDHWLDFFKIVSSLFAHKEQRPTLDEHKDIKLGELMRKYYRHNKSKRNLTLLRAFKVSTESINANDSGKIADYYLLLIDLKAGTISVTEYAKEDYEKATLDYYELEDSIDVPHEAVVLVATSSYKNLKEAYPSYFSDISEFINSLERVEENCKRLGLT